VNLGRGKLPETPFLRNFLPPILDHRPAVTGQSPYTQNKNAVL
jgi:hypothetical protein